MSRLRLFALAGALCAFASHAAEPVNEICYSAEVTVGAAPPTNDTAFVCPVSGTGTINALAGQGLRIVKLMPVSTGALTLRYQLIVARSRIVHEDGFET
jgi:hypothetical protein